MFDWNDEEIANIIWGETGESDDHIVPFPNGSERKSSNSETEEQKKPSSSTNIHDVNVEQRSKYETNESLPAEHGMISWPAALESNSAKPCQASVGTDTSNTSTEFSKNDSSQHAGESARHNNSSEIFQNQQGTEEGDYVDYGWANIGSFDDLGRIFSDDPIFGHASLNSVDELWSSSKDVASSREKSIPLSFDSPSLEVGVHRSSLDQFEVKSEYVPDQDPIISDYGKMTDVTSRAPRDPQPCVNTLEYSKGKHNPLQKGKTVTEASGKIHLFNEQLNSEDLSMNDKLMDKRNRKKRPLKARVKSEDKSQVRLHDIHGTLPTSGGQLQEFDSKRTTSQSYSPLVMSQQMHLWGPESIAYNHFYGPVLASPMYANMITQDPHMAAMPQLPPGEGNHPKVISRYEVSPAKSNPLNKASYASLQPLPMTPQEKIEKLRRRQQMRAMLAIQKQQQFHNPNEPPIVVRGISEVEGNSYVLPSIDPSSCTEQDNPNTICCPIDCSVEDSILSRLQDVIKKLDNRIRLSIRDSLFRLAESATQRRLSGDTSSTNRSSINEMFNKERNIQNGFARMPVVETETNPIDRTVAHLLFHRLLESSGKHSETPGSSLPVDLPHERKDSTSFPTAVSPEISESKNIRSPDQPIVTFLLPQRDESKDSTCLDTTKIVMDNEDAGNTL